MPGIALSLARAGVVLRSLSSDDAAEALDLIQRILDSYGRDQTPPDAERTIVPEECAERLPQAA